MHNYRAYVFLVVFLVVFTTSFIPTISYGLEEARDTFSEDEVNAFNLLREMDSGGVVTNVNEGNIVAYFSGKSNIMDEDFVLVPDASQRLEDINNLYSTHSKIIAVRIMDKYNASYIYLSEDSMNNYGITDLPSADEDCISLVYTSGVKIYKNRCKI